MGRINITKDYLRNVSWRREAIHDGANVAGAAKQFRDQCAKDILFWINTFAFTYDPRKENKVLPFITYPYQDKAILQIVDAIEDGHDVGIMKSRDMGASWINIIVPTWYLLFKDMSSFLMVSRNETYVDNKGDPKCLFWKIDFVLNNLPKWMKPRSGFDRVLLHIMNQDTGSVIDGESTTGEVARGDRRTAILMDEFAAFEVKSGYNAMSSTQSATNCRIFNSTPKGAGNAFYDVINKSSADIIRMHWSEHPEKAVGLYTSYRDLATGKMAVKLLDKFKGIVETREKGDRNSKKVAFPDDYPFVLDGKTRSPWYDLQCSRAVTPQEISQELDIDFLGSDYQFFDPVAVERYKENYCVDPQAIGNIDLSGSENCTVRFMEAKDGRMRLFEMPNGSGRWDEGRQFVMGVDVSAGTGASNSTIAIYDLKSTEKVAEYANPNILPDDFGRLVAAVARWFNEARIIPDRTGPTGEVLVARLITENYYNIYCRKSTKKVYAKPTNEPGVWLNPQLRTTILQQYRDAISHCTIINRSRLAMDETMRFICKMDGSIEHSASANSIDPSGARSNHGDMVIADALAYLGITEEGSTPEAEKVEMPEGSLAWRMEFEKKKNIKESEFSLGEEWAV